MRGNTLLARHDPLVVGDCSGHNGYQLVQEQAFVHLSNDEPTHPFPSLQISQPSLNVHSTGDRTVNLDHLVTLTTYVSDNSLEIGGGQDDGQVDIVDLIPVRDDVVCEVGGVGVDGDTRGDCSMEMVPLENHSAHDNSSVHVGRQEVAGHLTPIDLEESDDVESEGLQPLGSHDTVLQGRYLVVQLDRDGYRILLEKVGVEEGDEVHDTVGVRGIDESKSLHEHKPPRNSKMLPRYRYHKPNVYCGQTFHYH